MDIDIDFVYTKQALGYIIVSLVKIFNEFGYCFNLHYFAR